MITYPLWFKVFLGFGCFLVITGLLKHFVKDKVIDSFNQLPNEKKGKMITSYTQIVFIYKIYLYSTPLHLLVLFAIYKYSPQNFFHLTLIEIICFLLIISDLIYRHSILKEIKAI